MAHPVYLTYAEYTLRGGSLSEDAFCALEFRARKRIDYLTASRVQAMATVPEAVKQCMVSLVLLDSVSGAEAQAENPAVTSFSADGYSESYGKALGALEAPLAMRNAIHEMLYGEKDDNGTPLLYRGLDR